MKKELLIASLFACGAAVAGEFVSETTGILKCSSDKKETIVSIPWVGYGKDANGEDVKIQVNEIVRTTGLDEGDQLLAPNGSGGYNCWVLENGAWKATAKTVVGSNGSSTSAGASADATLQRGDGFWLVKATTPTAPFTYYLLGQKPASDAAIAKELTAAGWNLVANSGTVAKTLDQLVPSPAAGDLVVTADGNKFVKNRSGKWMKYVGGIANVDASTFTIDAGKGFWYNKQNSSEKATLAL